MLHNPEENRISILAPQIIQVENKKRSCVKLNILVFVPTLPLLFEIVDMYNTSI